MKAQQIQWTRTTTKPPSMETVVALCRKNNLYSACWDADEGQWFNGQDEAELPPLKWWAAITFPKES